MCSLMIKECISYYLIDGSFAFLKKDKEFKKYLNLFQVLSKFLIWTKGSLEVTVIIWIAILFILATLK